MKLRAGTYAWLGVALGTALLVHAGRDDPDGANPGFVSTRSSARRVFPELPDVTVETATLRLEPAAGDSVELRPRADGHGLWVDGVLVGPADPRAVEGLWASLRMATTVRAVAEGVEIGVARTGEIQIESGGVLRSVVVGGVTADGAGLLGVIDDPGFDPSAGDGAQTWVVEHELGEILAQAPQAWLSRRAVVVEPGQVTEVTLPEGSMVRGPDSRWRSEVPGAEGDVVALLSTDAVEARLGRLVSARMSPMLPDTAAAEGSPWVQLGATGGRRWILTLAGSCPDGSGRQVLQRGPGWPGCIDAALTESWSLPGSAATGGNGLLESRLSPYAYGRILRVEQRSPSVQTLSRNAGDWRLTTAQGVRDIDGPDVFTWYETLHGAEVELATDAEPPSWAVDVELTTDSTQRLRIRCTAAGPQRLCRRDDGPLLRLRTPNVLVATSPQTFVDRDLVAVGGEDVRSIEITGAGAVRQSVHFDLGVWRLDAPIHPEGDQALSDVYLEAILAAVGRVRVEQWVPRPAEAPARVLRLEQTPQRGRPTTVTLEVWPADDATQPCIVAVEQRAGVVRPGACVRLLQDLLHSDPVQYWVDTARSIEVTMGERTTRFERQPQGLVADGDHAEAAWARLRALAQRPVVGLESGVRTVGDDVTLRVQPGRGEPIEAVAGPDFVSLRGVGWTYRLGPVP